MNSHKHARLTPKGRALLVSRVLDEGWTVAMASRAAGVSKRTGFKWLARFKAEGIAGLTDRSSRPRRCPRALTAQEQGELEGLRRRRWPLWRIAMQTRRGVATVSRCMKRLGLSQLKALEPPMPVVRYERTSAGELLHIDTKRLGRIDGIGHRITGDRTYRHRGVGWDMVHLAIDDHSRVSFAQVLPDEKAVSCVQFLREAVTYYASLGVRIQRVMTDNGKGLQERLQGCVQRTEHPAHQDSAVHAQDQRQGRTLRADQPTRVGVCQALRNLSSARGGLAALPPSLQLASATLSTQPPATHEPYPNHEQPLGTQQLVRLYNVLPWRVRSSLHPLEERSNSGRP